MNEKFQLRIYLDMLKYIPIVKRSEVPTKQPNNPKSCKERKFPKYL